MYTVEQALENILAAVSVGATRRVPLLDSLGRVLAEDVYSDIPLPPFTNSAVDGYAVRASDTAGANADAPILLTCIEDIPAGAWPQQTLGRGACARIMTGAPVPSGADAIVMVEDTREDKETRRQNREQGTGNREQGTRRQNREQGTGNREQGTRRQNREQGTGNREQGTGNREQGTGNREQKEQARTTSRAHGPLSGGEGREPRATNHERIAILEAARVGQHVRVAGEDAQVGERMLAAGDVIGAAQIGLLAQMGRDSVLVTRPPRVAVISTGDEVVEIASGVIPEPGKIRNSNSYALAALVREAGGVVHSRRHLPDDLAATQAALRECALREEKTADRRQKTEGAALEEGLEEDDYEEGADVIVTAGGVSVGDRDFIKPALESLGTLDLWRVAMKPGKPLAFGRIGRTLFFGLPGNPVSALVTFALFVRPALRKMAGVREGELRRRQVTATLLAPISHVPPRREYVRAFTEWRESGFVTLPLSGQSSANMATLARANSLLIVPEQSEGAKAGDTLPVLLLD